MAGNNANYQNQTTGSFFNNSSAPMTNNYQNSFRESANYQNQNSGSNYLNNTPSSSVQNNNPSLSNTFPVYPNKNIQNIASNINNISNPLSQTTGINSTKDGSLFNTAPKKLPMLGHALIIRGELQPRHYVKTIAADPQYHKFPKCINEIRC